MTDNEQRSGSVRGTLAGRSTSGPTPINTPLPIATLTNPGGMLGKYQLIAEIARGGMGVVYLAMLQGPGGFNKLVVVKELKPELVEEPAFLTMFLDEARLAARLSHPNIVQTNEVGNDGDRYFLAMDYLDGRGLDQIRRRSRTAGFGLSVPMHLRVVCDMLAGLDYAHKLTDFDGSPLNIVHRDVSPQNVFVTFDGQVKLLDFGIAKASDSMHETHAGVVKGKVSYMSPEQGRGWKVDARADVFSAGVMLWEALTGRRMREGKNEQEKLWALVSADVPRASSIKPWIPPQLDDVCARAMAWDRDERYPTAGAMQQDLEAYLSRAGTNVSAREVGACVSELFREDRASTNAVIEAHIARARGGAMREKLPIIDVASRLGVGSHTPSNEREPSGAPNHTGLAASLASPTARSGEISAAPSGTAPSAVTSPPIVPSVVAPAEPAGREPARSIKSVLIAGVTGVVVAAVAIILVSRATREASMTTSSQATPAAVQPSPMPAAPQPSPPAAQPTAPAAEPTPAKKASFVDVEIRVSPRDAQLSIDGTVVEGNPFVSRYASDEVVHHVRASAPGYVAKSVPVWFSANVTLDLSLERLPPVQPTRPTRPTRPPGRTSTATRPSEPVQPPEPVHPPEPAVRPNNQGSAATRPPGEISPTGGSKPRRPIDPTNPYGAGE